jgi:uncharacterized protein (TIGR02284 family)
MESNEKTIQTLKGLFTICRASEYGFRAAAASLGDKTVRDLITACADQYQEFVEELRNEIRFYWGQEFNAEPPGDAWKEILAAVETQRQDQILSACERMQQALLRTYETALTMDFPWDTESFLLHHLSEIKNACFYLNALELFSQHQFAV